ncbi:hypothetical protein SAMN05216389_11322 [Oceanobacillus limi]|uniref:DUF7847 domain-containing protein n=1 Tax=Oceanobacillus limi TaxID=930131 RepID=A0A1I0F009_9BACI|nr:hypothetical protein [Oceanobacillus limi]SET50536.1 hypothetical protein SAMN05216389_11322 [Oceanobacillus limi]
MDEQFNRSKGFGEILDHTFRLCKHHFSKLFLIFLIIIGPLYLLEALLLFMSGTSFFRHMGTGSNLFEQVISGYDETLYNSTVGQDVFLGLAMLVLAPVAYAAVLISLNLLKYKKDFTPSQVIKKAFSKFWPIFGSSLLFGVIVFSLIFGLFMIITIPGFIVGLIHPVLGFIFGAVFFLGIGLVLALLLTRWSFYLAATVLEEDMPGLARSWRLTRENTWKVFGLYIVIGLITAVIGVAIEGVFTFILGNSVLFTIIVNVVSILTSMIFAVAYAVIYFDLKFREDGEDLQELIDDYKHQ